jgi:hypothetical protein
MVVSPDPFLDECFIKKPNKKQSTVADDLEEDIVKNSDNLFATPLTKTGINNNLTKSVSTSDETFSNIEVDIIDIDKKTETNTAFNSKTTVNINPLKNADIQLGDITELDFDLDLNSNDTNDTNDTNDNIVLEIEDLSPEPIKIEDTNILKEVDLSPSLENNLESITLKKPNQVYYEIYKKAREKAKEAKKEAILAFLEAKNIKKTYMLDDIDESDEEDDEDFNFNETEE